MSVFGSSSATTNNGPTRGIKRKAVPNSDKPPRKRIRLSEGEHPSTSEGSREQFERTVREDKEGLLKRKRRLIFEDEQPSTSEDSREQFERTVREDEEGLPMKKKRRVDIIKHEEGLQSGSTDTYRESCQKPTEEEVKRGRKGKADKGGEGPRRKRTRKRSEQREAKEEARQSSVAEQKALFEAKYQELELLGKGGFGSVFAGYRKADNLPVAIKRIQKEGMPILVDNNGKRVVSEVAIMSKLTKATGGKVGASVSLLDWYDLDQELILVLERPVPSMDLSDYMDKKGGILLEEEAKVLMKQLVEALIELEDNHIFHRDIKLENILIETGSDVPRLRLIDFGLSCFFKQQSCFRIFSGTIDHIPPEFFKRSFYRAGPTTVWQMGIVLFDMIRLTTRFESDLYLNKCLKINDMVSEECQDFLRMCLTRNPKRRPTLDQLRLHPWLR